MGDESTTIARARPTELRSLMRILRGDLDWIVMKCLEKDQTRRYEAASALALDVDRFLNREAILAGPPTVGYRARKFIRRHRIAVVSAAGVVLALALGVVGTTAGTVSRAPGRGGGASRGGDLRARGRIHVQRPGRSGPLPHGHAHARGPEPPRRGVQAGTGIRCARWRSWRGPLRRAACSARRSSAVARPKAIESDIPSDPLIAAGLYQSIGRAYQRMGLYKEAEPYARSALETRERLLGPDHPRRSARPELMGDLCYGLSRFTEMEAFHRRTFGPGPACSARRTRRRSRR